MLCLEKNLFALLENLVAAVPAESNKAHLLHHRQSQNQKGPSFQTSALLPAAQHTSSGLCPPAPQGLHKKPLTVPLSWNKGGLSPRHLQEGRFQGTTAQILELETYLQFLISF